MIIRPPKLKKGDKIGVIAPAGPVTASELQPSIKLLQKYGYDIIISPNIFSQADYLAGEDNIRLYDINMMFESPEIKAIFCARGGYGSLRLLDKISYDLIREKPKIFLGYSDITALLIAIFRKTGLITFHGPMIRELAGMKKRFLNNLFNAVSSVEPLKLEFPGGKSLRAGIAEGVFMGGNLSLICSMMGTPYFPSLDGAILFVEERGEALYKLDRMFTQLRLGGHLKGLKALIFGGFEDCGDDEAIEKLLTNITSDFGFPVCSGFPIGHGDENITVPVGAPAILDTKTMTLTFRQPCVKA